VLQGVKAWQNSRRKEQRTFHARGGGTFIIDGQGVDLHARMTKRRRCI
jgi:hypothetical protein